jgi:phosphotransferase system enzyme I (PtsI)
MTQPRERIVRAEIASPGLARGVIYRMEGNRRPAVTQPSGNPAEEAEALRRAVARAKEDLEAQADRAAPMAAEMMTLRIALLSDPGLIAAALEAIGGGEPAESAFRDAMDIRIADCRAGRGLDLRAQVRDLVDIRDRVLRHLTGASPSETRAMPEGAIVVAEDVTPLRFLETDWRRSRGLVLTKGSASGHLAMLARARGVPLLIELDAELDEFEDGVEAVLDAEAGRLICHPGAATIRDYDGRIAEQLRRRAGIEREASRPARTADGTRISVCLNVDDPLGLETVKPAHCDGIGLVRSEFLFRHERDLRDEERQYRLYRALLHWAEDLPVTVRTLDAGGDKPVPGLIPENGTGSLRGLALSLARPEIFRVQLRALARAARHGPLRVMVPMVRSPDDLEQARRMLGEEVAALAEQRIAAALPPFGMMVETPAAVRDIDDFGADFFSVGTNDLVRSVLAEAEQGVGPAGPCAPLDPAVLAMIERVCARGRELGIEVGVCGEAASQPQCIPVLLKVGVRALSVPPTALAEAKEAVGACRLE